MKTHHKIDVAIIGLTLAGLLFLVGYAQPLVIAPVDGYESVETAVLFEIEKAEQLLIDDNQEFSSPKAYTIKDGLKIRLEPGLYYWKAVGVTQSKVRTLTIQTLIDLEIRQNEEGSYGVANAGNVDVRVDVYDQGDYIKTFNLQPSEENAAEADHFAGEMK